MGLHECQWKSAFPPSNWILVNRDDGYARPKKKKKKEEQRSQLTARLKLLFFALMSIFTFRT
jgi:hypothetical protein